MRPRRPGPGGHPRGRSPAPARPGPSDDTGARRGPQDRVHRRLWTPRTRRLAMMDRMEHIRGKLLEEDGEKVLIEEVDGYLGSHPRRDGSKIYFGYFGVPP